ncbi:translation initiation factor IF-2 [Desulfonatronospira sp.]|uniref:translation initiation factor IF-2 n=1 Tax=Desulfonatronospira sp. TaxID=1962951 RepID=UPI0025C3291A|nr:translation initiation factor IF-2 [Desulfonatronospira sp.]
MTTKMRVRDISQELGISNKELIHLLRDLNIQVKSHMSGLTEEQVELVRERHKNGADQSVTQSMAKSGVIVRRRKKPDPATADPSVPPEDIITPPADEDIKTVPEHPEKAPEAAQEPKIEQETVSTDITLPPDQTSKEQPAAKTPGPEQQDKEKKPGKPAPGGRKTRKKKAPPEEPRVKVISRPEPETAPKTPLMPEIKKPEVPGPAPGKAAPAEAPAADDDSREVKKKRRKKKDKKDKRVVEFDSTLPDSAAQKQSKTTFRKQKTSPVSDKTGGRLKPGRSRKPRTEPRVQEILQPTKAFKKKIRIDEAIRVSDLAKQMGIKAQEIIKTLLGLGIMATINQSIDLETASIVAAEHGYEVEKTGFSEEEFIIPRDKDKPEEMLPRPPVVTIMGHVDHGKTSLLDSIRKSKIASGEAGGITQHIGAYYVGSNRGDIVFLDTPGHEAFTAMRARGAQITDIVILVVAADDGVMDQTREAVNHSRAAGVPIVVAVNKIDKEDSDPDRVKRELAELGLVPEDWGGDTIYTHVSAKQGIGIDDLLEMVLLQAEVLELHANPNKFAVGHIVEARLDKGRGALGTVLVQGGTLKHGDAFVCGLYHGKIRAMFNDKGKKIDQAGPSVPVEIQGLEGVPEAGDEFVVVQDEKVARRIAETRQTKQRDKDLARESKITLESFLASKAEGGMHQLNLVVKADVQGSLEAIAEALNKQSTSAVKINIIHGGAGSISESDIMLASASSAIVIGFNVRPTPRVKEVAERESVEIRFYDIIYNLVNDIRDAMAGMLDPIIKEEYLGQAQVLQTFSVPRVGMVAGCMVMDGRLIRNGKARLLRDGVVVYTGSLSSLKRFKEDVKDVTKGYECGVGLDKFNDIKVGDIIEAYQEREEKATL